MSELHWEAAIGIVLNVHNFSVVGQDEKLTTSEEKKKVKQDISVETMQIVRMQ